MNGAPLIHNGSVKSEWIDYNGHMGDYAYGIIFTEASDKLLDLLGMSEQYRQQTGRTAYTLETHITYLKELHEGDAVRIFGQLVDHDEKRIHAILSMANADGELCAFYEVMLMHIQIGKDGKPAAEKFPAGLFDRIKTMFEQHKSLPRPEKARRSIGIRRRDQMA